MALRHLLCPECGKEGHVTRRAIAPGAGIDIMTGLDPEGCDRCRELLKNNGYALVPIPVEALPPEGG